MEYLFLLADLKQRSVLVIGGGNVAARKIDLLERSGAKISIVANSLCSELKKIQYINLMWIGKVFKPEMLRDVFLVIVATDDQELNNYIYCCAEKHHKFVNVVDDRSKCSLIFPAIIDRSPVMIAVTSSGRAPILVRMLREKLEALLPNFLGPMANLIGRWRGKIKTRILDVSDRRKFWENILHDNTFIVLVAKNLFSHAARFLHNALNDNKKTKKSIGSVALVGAGPGDSGLFTLRGLQIVQEADVVLYDYLVTSEILDLVRREAKKICVGKRGGHEEISMTQNEINHLLVTLAKKGNRVVRLKGGDPFIFGRGGEELEEVIQAGIPCQVIPGVTAASSVSIYAGIPLTHRDYAHSVIFITGYFLSNFCDKFDFHFLSHTYQTIVIYMSGIHIGKIRGVLLSNGCDTETPVAVISSGTCYNQKVSIGILDNVERLIRLSCSPSLLIVGNVVNLHNKMFWLCEKEMKGYKFTSLINLF